MMNIPNNTPEGWAYNMRAKVRVLGTVGDYVESGLSLQDYTKLVDFFEGRKFKRWLRKNENKLCAVAVAGVFAFFPDPAFAAAVVTKGSFFEGHGVILLHMLVVGFLTLVVTTFLKFTGRGDLGPLVVFIGGAIILYETLELFQALYNGIVNFFNM